MINFAKYAAFCLPLALSGCFIPYASKDPLQEANGLFQNEVITHDTLVNKIGPPDFVLDKYSYVWLGSTTGALYVFGFLPGATAVTGPISNRDYILAANFSSSGELIDHEISAESRTSDFCLVNGICFTSQTHDVPLAPAEWDKQAKKFEADDATCTVYVYRDSEGTVAAEDDYVHINVFSEPLNPTGENVDRRAHLPMASVPSGYAYWALPAAANVEIQALYNHPLNYKFGVGMKADRKRPWDHISFPCEANEIKYVRLFVPERRKHPSELGVVSAEQAQLAIKELRLVLKLGWGGFFGPAGPEALFTDPH